MASNICHLVLIGLLVSVASSQTLAHRNIRCGNANGIFINVGGESTSYGYRCDIPKMWNVGWETSYTSTRPVISSSRCADHMKTHAFTAEGDLVYSIPVPAGRFLLDLQFMENYYTQEGGRAFTIEVDGQALSIAGNTTFDIVERAGGRDRPYVVRHWITKAAPGNILITLGPLKDLPILSGIVVTGSGARNMVGNAGWRTCNSANSGSRVPTNLSVNFHRVADDYPLKVFESAGTVLEANGENSLVIFGGYENFPNITRRVYRRTFGVENAPWTRLRDLPSHEGTHIAQIAGGEELCGVGGFEGRFPGISGHSAFCYNLRTNTYRSLADLPANRAGGGLNMVMTQSYGRLLVYAGGVDRPEDSMEIHNDSGDTWVFWLDYANQQWIPVQNEMPDPRNHMATVATCGRYLFVGGQHEFNEASGNRATISEYMPNTATWSTTPPAKLPLPLGHISASTLPYQCGVIIVGGNTRAEHMSNIPCQRCIARLRHRWRHHHVR